MVFVLATKTVSGAMIYPLVVRLLTRGWNFVVILFRVYATKLNKM